MMENGANIATVSKILGHSDIKTPMRYAHPQDSPKDAVEKLGNFNQKTIAITIAMTMSKIVIHF